MTREVAQVEFHGDRVWAVREGGEVLVAIKPICESLGLDWKSQYRRLSQDVILNEGMVVMTIPSPGGHQKTLCLPLGLLNGWLFGVDDRRIKDPDTRERVLLYKRECYQVLFQHFQGGRTAAAEAEEADPVPAGPEAWELTDINATRVELDIVNTARRISGRTAARRLWERMPHLPTLDPATAGDDSVARWTRARLTGAAGEQTPSDAAYCDYADWCRHNGESPVPRQTFGHRLGQIGVEKTRRGGRVYYPGVTLVA
ncbi:phage antirepressor N-terminal domain-containing protein [Ferruginivarius sediminum]|uniref:Antirepressor protein ant N-terminal domain-containing protein n=1 Tax=Ferruginivarius sediminum TaxID=2661937 RepID=A0A369T818_9PROT|nr:phage antirepressor N-terminal domain-containing protein [Ferruginivarius sediminum]RDD60495.1 hypothetical protein DRB17_18015 [Ferruginivarius sediminum]